MNPFQVVITAVLATIVTLALSVVAAWSLWPRTAEASVNLAHHADTWHTGESPHCAHLTNDHLIVGEAVLAALLDLDSSQATQLAQVTAKLEQWRADAQQTCINTDLGSLDGGLAGLETMLAQSAAHISQLRPAVNEFYAGLSEPQQTKLRDLVHNHAGREHRGMGRHAHSPQ